jgi:hypothetical protein
VPFVSKATGVPLAKIAARCMAGKSLAEQGAVKEIVPHYYSVKEAIFPFAKFQNVDPILGPEMRSTGECGVGLNWRGVARAEEAANIRRRSRARRSSRCATGQGACCRLAVRNAISASSPPAAPPIT